MEKNKERHKTGSFNSTQTFRKINESMKFVTHNAFIVWCEKERQKKSNFSLFSRQMIDRLVWLSKIWLVWPHQSNPCDIITNGVTNNEFGIPRSKVKGQGQRIKSSCFKMVWPVLLEEHAIFWHTIFEKSRKWLRFEAHITEVVGWHIGNKQAF